ncbi:MAG: hypothetical protein HFI54_06165 [Lachnospiraceae bacterium]|nr:hypothetical protein [Lachnospiraceae bacterium]
MNNGYFLSHLFQLSNNHTSVGVGHMKEILREAFVIYLGYEWVEIDG